MTASQKIEAMRAWHSRRGINLTYEDTTTLRRAQMTLHRWAELECGDGNDYTSWCVERDESTGVPYLVTYPHNGSIRRRSVADRERGALRRVAEVCERNGLYWYHQTDPRGCALYIGTDPLTADDAYYSSRGVAVCDD